MRFSGRLTSLRPIGLVAVGIAVALAACSSPVKRATFEEVKEAPPGEGDPGFVPGAVPCQGLACKIDACEGQEKTTITGKVYDPAGANALYNVMVYIPGGPNGDADLPEIKEGVQCETCASVALSPLVSTLTNTKGEFELKNVPVDKDVPVVIQVGKWRRKLKFDVTKKCAANEVGDRDFRLPKNGSEGDMPHIAVTAGGCDALECLLRGIGVDDKEFVPGHSTAGHIHVFNGEGGDFTGAPEAGGTATDTLGGELWNDPAKMANYDMVMLSCECSENNQNKGGDVGRPGARQSMWDYANMGGKIFATHYHYTWFKNSPQEDWRQTANWTPAGGGSGAYDVDQTPLRPRAPSSSPTSPTPSPASRAPRRAGSRRATTPFVTSPSTRLPRRHRRISAGGRSTLTFTSWGSARAAPRSPTVVPRLVASLRSRRPSSSCSSTSPVASRQTTPRPSFPSEQERILSSE
jgi:hypothetical protein